MNQMNVYNLVIVFGFMFFQIDGQDYKVGCVVEDFINYYVVVFSVDEEEFRKQWEEIIVIVKMCVVGIVSGIQYVGDFICIVYLEEKKVEIEQYIKVLVFMIVEEFILEILDCWNVGIREKDYWICFEVNEREEVECFLYFVEKVLFILYGLGMDSYLVVKKYQVMEVMLLYLVSCVGDIKYGMMKFCEDCSFLGLGLFLGGFYDCYFIFNSSCLWFYKEVWSYWFEKEWFIKSFKVYLGVKKKFRLFICWGFIVVYEIEKYEKQQWYFCCDIQMEFWEWFVIFLFVQYDGLVWFLEFLCVFWVVFEVWLGSVLLIFFLRQ